MPSEESSCREEIDFCNFTGLNQHYTIHTTTTAHSHTSWNRENIFFESSVKASTKPRLAFTTDREVEEAASVSPPWCTPHDAWWLQRPPSAPGALPHSWADEAAVPTCHPPARGKMRAEEKRIDYSDIFERTSLNWIMQNKCKDNKCKTHIGQC